MADVTSTILIKPEANLAVPIKAGTLVATVTCDPAASNNLRIGGSTAPMLKLVGTAPNYTLVAAVDIPASVLPLHCYMSLAEPFMLSAGGVIIPPPPPPPPPPGAWPGQAGNPVGYKTAAGYPGTLIKWAGGSLTAGQTVSFVWFDDNLPTVPDNVTFLGCRFTSNSVDYANVVSAQNVVFRACTFEPRPTIVTAPPQPAWPSGGAGKNVHGSTGGGFEPYMIPHGSGYQFALVKNSGTLLMEGCDIWGFGNAITLFGSAQKIIRGCWIHDAAAEGTGAGMYHTDGPGHLNGSGCSNVLIEHSTIASLGNTNGIAFQAGVYSGITVRFCYLSGFGYCVDMGHANPNNTALTFEDNVIATDLGWEWGPIYTDFTASFRKAGSSWKRNKFHVAAGTRPAGSSNVKYTAADDGKFIHPNGTLSATDWAA